MKKNSDKKKIVYISGAGHSGSTMLDIVLGSTEHSMSVGELMFFPRKGILNKEYCSCGERVPECKFWAEVNKQWEENRKLSLIDYTDLQDYLLSKKHILQTYWKLHAPSEKIKSFIEDTRSLYDAIFEVSGTAIIVDSSKAPSKILILKLLGYDLQVVHLIRRFGDVLNSNKKKAPKNLKEGREHEIKPKSTLLVTFIWFIDNFLTKVYSKNTKYSSIKYEQLVKDPEKEIPKIFQVDSQYKLKLKERGPFKPLHLVAGNTIRMKDYLYIAEKPMNTSYRRLNLFDKLLAKCVDQFY